VWSPVATAKIPKLAISWWDFWSNHMQSFFFFFFFFFFFLSFTTLPSIPWFENYSEEKLPWRSNSTMSITLTLHSSSFPNLKRPFFFSLSLSSLNLLSSHVSLRSSPTTSTKHTESMTRPWATTSRSTWVCVWWMCVQIFFCCSLEYLFR
jgi:hypothetical protein